MKKPIRHPLLRAIADAPTRAPALSRSAPDPELAADLERFESQVETWAADRADPAAWERAGGVPAEILGEAAELGLFGLSIPERYGGTELPAQAVCRLIERLARHDASLAVTIGLHCGLGVRALVAYGSDPQRERYLPDLARGRRIAALSATEAEAGSDIASVRTTATRDGLGGGLRLSGSKLYVTNGGIADLYTVLARMPDHDARGSAYGLLLVERGAPGLAVGREEHKLGLRASSTTPLHFDGVRLAPDAVIGEPGRGLEKLFEVLSWGRVLLSSGCLGAARTSAEAARRHVIRRHQFARPLARFGQVREKIARSEALIYAMESVIRLATGPDRDDADIWESQAAKVFCTEATWQVIDDAVQLHGGSGFIEGTGLPRRLRDARVTRIFEGANEVLRFDVAATAFLFMDHGFDACRDLAERVGPALAPEAARFDAWRAALDQRIESLFRRHGSALFEQQLLLRELSDALIALYALLAVLLRAGDPAGRDEAGIAIARYLTLRFARSIEPALAGCRCPAEIGLVDQLSEAACSRE